MWSWALTFASSFRFCKNSVKFSIASLGFLLKFIAFNGFIGYYHLDLAKQFKASFISIVDFSRRKWLSWIMLICIGFISSVGGLCSEEFVYFFIDKAYLKIAFEIHWPDIRHPLERIHANELMGTRKSQEYYAMPEKFIKLIWLKKTGIWDSLSMSGGRPSDSHFPSPISRLNCCSARSTT